MALEDTNRLAGDCRVKLLDFFFSSVTNLRPSSSRPLSSTLRYFTISLPGETPPATKMCWNSTSKVQHSQIKS